MNGLLTAIQNVAALLPVMTLLTVTVAFIAGLVFFIKAIRGLTGGGRDGVNVPSVVTQFIVGTLLITLGGSLMVFTGTLFGTTTVSKTEEIFSQAPNTIGLVTDDGSRMVIRAIVGIVQFVGLIGFIRGLMMLTTVSNGGGQSASFGSAMTFLIAGTIGINFPRFVGLISQLFI